MVERVLQAIAEPHRREILLLLQDTELSASEIAAHFTDVTRPAISQHLMLLAQVGLVTMRRQGTKRLYRTRPEGLEDLRRFLESFWDKQLGLLKHAAETEEGSIDKLGPSPT
jgi:DNA-binding transcriptional ArsR family regulator